MGGGGSTEYITQTIDVYADPKLLEELEKSKQETSKLSQTLQKMSADLRTIQLEAQKKGDPALYHQYREEVFDKFVDHLGTMTFSKPIQKSSASERHHILMGNISSGKSSLINKFFGLNEPVGSGQCTLKPKKVITIGNVTIWDSPGINEDFKIYDPEVLAFFHCADKIFILFPDSLKSSSEIVKVLAKIKPNQTFIVRTQTDNWNSKMKKTIKEQIQTDKALLAKWRINLPIYATSAKKDLNFQDNKIVYDMIRLA